ncbi:MAG: hypothetical protein RLZZ501_2570 [Pseudomonadota bacterium]
MQGQASKIAFHLADSRQGARCRAVGPRRAGAYAGNAEPPLDELVNDPMVRGLMARDGVALDSLCGLIAEVRRRLA